METNEANIQKGIINDPDRVILADLKDHKECWLKKEPEFECIWQGKKETPFAILCFGKEFMVVRKFPDQCKPYVTNEYYVDKGLVPYHAASGHWNTRYTRRYRPEPVWHDDWL